MMLQYFQSLGCGLNLHTMSLEHDGITVYQILPSGC